MLIVRTPLRISLVGGGTDIPSIYKEIGYGKVLTLAINKYIYISAHSLLEDSGILLKYSKTEKVSDPDELIHPMAREILKMFKVKSLDLSITSDIPAGTGMGSSSSFTVNLLTIMHTYLGLPYTKTSIAELACNIEIDKLGEPIGKQDQYIAALGGIQSLKFETLGNVVSTDMTTIEEKSDVSNMLHLVRVGGNRSASEILREQQSFARQNPDILKKYKKLLDLANDAEKAFSKLDFRELGLIITESWFIKKTLSPGITNNEIDSVLSIGESLGAWGGKLLGAGGSGYIFFLGDQELKERLKQKFLDRYLSVRLDYEGSKVIYHEE